MFQFDGFQECLNYSKRQHGSSCPADNRSFKKVWWVVAVFSGGGTKMNWFRLHHVEFLECGNAKLYVLSFYQLQFAQKTPTLFIPHWCHIYGERAQLAWVTQDVINSSSASEKYKSRSLQICTQSSCYGTYIYYILTSDDIYSVKTFLQSCTILNTSQNVNVAGMNRSGNSQWWTSIVGI